MMMLFSTGLLAHAETTDFTLTVNNFGYQQDNLSKRTLKAGGTDYGNKCYVRATNFVKRITNMHLRVNIIICRGDLEHRHLGIRFMLFTAILRKNKYVVLQGQINVIDFGPAIL